MDAPADVIPPRLLRDYKATRYEAEGVTIRIGRRSTAMDDLLGRMGTSAGGFITAWNPLSRRMPEGWNHRMQRSLAERLRRHAGLPANGSLHRWHEAHLLTTAHPRRLLRLARLFRQRGVVVVKCHQPARLMLLDWRW
ncbi:MAG TPA: DUF3293 domain-containing protein [Acetobacteraceae bacterium]|jgi:hypothetical protein|nr:DUF3293 domain-containing protein [Acetobacteraceae bacterium]